MKKFLLYLALLSSIQSVNALTLRIACRAKGIELSLIRELVDEWTKLLNNEYGYNGEAQTVDGLQYLRSRYYDAETGVFISRDSYRGEVQDLLSQNRYTYARNNPIKYDDPTGHLPLNGVNKYASNASMDVGDSLKRLEPLKGSFSSTGTKNTSYNKGPLLTGTSKTPLLKQKQ